MTKLKKDGVTPKLSGGSRGGGRPSKNRTKTNFYCDNDLVEEFCSLSADEKNLLIRKGLGK